MHSKLLIECQNVTCFIKQSGLAKLNAHMHAHAHIRAYSKLHTFPHNSTCIYVRAHTHTYTRTYTQNIFTVICIMFVRPGENYSH